MNNNVGGSDALPDIPGFKIFKFSPYQPNGSGIVALATIRVGDFWFKDILIFQAIEDISDETVVLPPNIWCSPETRERLEGHIIPAFQRWKAEREVSPADRSPGNAGPHPAGRSVVTPPKRGIETVGGGKVYRNQAPAPREKVNRRSDVGELEDPMFGPDAGCETPPKRRQTAP